MRTDYAIIAVALIFIVIAGYFEFLELIIVDLPFKAYIFVLSTGLLLSSIVLLVFMTAVFRSKKAL